MIPQSCITVESDVLSAQRYILVEEKVALLGLTTCDADHQSQIINHGVGAARASLLDPLCFLCGVPYWTPCVWTAVPKHT